MTKSNEKPDDSETTGMVPLGSALGKAIGLLYGGTGLAKPRMTAIGLPAVRAVTAAEAVETDEREIDRPDSWPIPLRSCIVGVRWVNHSSIDYGWDGSPSSFDVRPAASVETIELARTYWKAYRDLCAPLDEASLARAIVRLRKMTISRAEEGEDWQVTLDAWLDSLAPYPADIVLWAIGFWQRNEKWWPAWSEFQLLLEKRVGARRACMDALQQIGERGQAQVAAE